MLRGEAGSRRIGDQVGRPAVWQPGDDEWRAGRLKLGARERVPVQHRGSSADGSGVVAAAFPQDADLPS